MQPVAAARRALSDTSTALLRLVPLLAVLVGLVCVAPAGRAGDQPEQAAGGGPVIGAQFHGMWSSYTDVQRENYLDQLAASGATQVRLDVSWAMLQPTDRDNYDMRWGVPFVDRVLRMVTDRGLTPLVTLWLTPRWANGGAGERVLPADPQDYARAASWAAQRWAGTVGAWEVWNEPNHPSYLVGADTAAYVRLLKAAYPAIKGADASATVVFGGPSLNDTAWIQRAYDAGAQGSFDAMATHPYQGVADLAPSAPDDGTKYRFTHLAAVHAVMKRNGDGDKPVWATEFGWSSHANSGSEGNWQRGVTEDQQAEYLVEAIELARTTMPYVTHMFWYSDRDSAALSVQEGNYGLVREDGSPKPVLLALGRYLRRVP